ncbi:bifunctional hydroxymethylpyrimidine kinase/phosphomethylpyrimidine kinase [Sphingomonas sp. NFR15]|uniref:bifunctional hydroxymethylpyrimidine kinase/phosphomethylpyrimidine kinase n=1 Tax=Sphingomonas sp. NFR15 TaxID=1566282 RepID=UPI000887EF50|nr:bifunctional hydroxymethylpyrimidine kinase/phosphomethylpyrimidine kinase [Sphingomonas sp. NFR15]SDA16710.1 hydroxymethylpyrimidine/phosphomethylpyrimidine kinase [Sphingomonas sp. NFR15]
MTPRILIIAGSDSGGGAGIQADIKTVTMLGGHAMTAITAITAQNTTGVQAVLPVPADMVVAQIEACVSDIGVDAIKIGMIGSAETAHAVADAIESLEVPIVFDPVMVATSGAALADADTIAAFGRLMRLATLVTPNLPELATLSPPVRPELVEGRVPGAAPATRASTSSARTEGKAETSARTDGDAERLAAATGTAILAKGGHAEGDTLTDRLVGPEGEIARWDSPRIETRHTHGTGCTLASAIATELARGAPLPQAVARGRGFVRLAMLGAPGFGAGHGPMGHQSVRLDAPDAPTPNQITLPLTDFAASAAFYEALGLRRIVDAPPRYARFESAGGVTLSIEAADEMPDGTMLYVECGDLDAAVAALRGLGAAVSDPADQRWGWREARTRDPAGNAICLYQAGEARRFPAWRIA